MLGGNTTANIQTKTIIKNSIGEMETTWSDIAIIKGFLDYESGQNDLSKYDAKVQETTHIFMCDYSQIAGKGVTSENCRLVCEGLVYDILMIDDVMELHKHVEIYLKYVGEGTGIT